MACVSARWVVEVTNIISILLSFNQESCDKSAKPGGGSVSKEKDEVSPATKKPPKENESADGKGSDEEVILSL